MKQDASIGLRMDALERAALGGVIGRRDYLARLLALGVSAATAGLMARQAHAAATNQQAQRAALRDEYDYIIVGAGSAGCVLAARLSATGASVLLIEAGGSDIEQAKIVEPRRWTQNLFTDTDWGRTSVPQPGLGNRPQAASGGKIWGGSGSINATIWLRGDVRDYRQWAAQVGPDWSLPALEQAYLRLATPQPQARAATGPWGSGPITVGRYATGHPLTAAYMEAGQEMGLKAIELNAGGAMDGIGIAEVNATPDGRRSGPAQAYLVPALARPTLTVLSATQVNQLALQGSTCQGIHAVVDGQARKITAARETILCAGTFETPRLLMLSGIGPADRLAPLGLQVRHALANVGENLQDHILLKGVHFKSRAPLPPPVMNGAAAFAYFSQRPGPASLPDVQLMCVQSPFLTATPATGAGFSIAPFLAKPRSKGSVRLLGTDPRAALAIDPAYLRESLDQEHLIMGLERALDMGNSAALKPFTDGFHTGAAPATRSEKMAFIAQNGGAGFHYVGTCAAGRSAADSVVNGRFRVWGMDRLMVVDGSVIPQVPAVNTHVAVLVLAELAAAQLCASGRC